MLPMNKKEFDNWTETRKPGSNKYSAKTSFTATIFVYLLYFVSNGFYHLDDINNYIAYNLSRLDYVAIMLGITFAAMFIMCKIIFFVNEKRYNETLKKNNNA